MLLDFGLLNLNGKIMTKDDFVCILIEAFAQDSPENFFRAQQKLRHKKGGYPKKGFADGLIRAFKWLHFHVNRTDHSQYLINTPSGQVISGVLMDNSQIESLRKMGELSFPGKNVLQICRESDFETALILESASMEMLWPELFRFLNPLFEGDVPHAPMFTHNEAAEYGGITEIYYIPDGITNYFTPIGTEPVERRSKDSNLNNNPDNLPAIVQEGKPELIVRAAGGTKFSINQLALILVYTGVTVTRRNSNEIVRKYGYESGEKLYQRYKLFSSSCDRRARLETDLQTKHKIQLFEGILGYLSKKERIAAEKDIAQIKKNLREEY